MRHYVYAGLLLSLLIPLYFIEPMLQGGSLGEGEGVIYYLPMRELVADAWRQGHWPLYNPYVFGGLPLLADCQAGTFYPPNLLFLWLDPIVAMNVVLLVGHLAAAWGMIFLLKAHHVRPWAAAVGAGAFVFSGFMIAHMGHVTIVNAAVWLPWLCLIMHHWCRTGRHRWLMLGTLFWAIQFFAGHPQIVVYSGLIVLMQTVGLLWYRRTNVIRAFGGLAVMALLAGLICAVQMLPTLEFSRLTGRNFDKDILLFENYRYIVKHTPLLWLPYLYGTQAGTPLDWCWHSGWNFVEQAGYLGLLPWMLLPAALGLRAGRRRLAVMWAVIAGLNLLLAWNTDIPLGRLTFHIPVYNGFEAAGRHLLGLILGLAMCAGIGLEAILRTPWPQVRRVVCWGSGAVVALVVLVVLAVTVYLLQCETLPRSIVHRSADAPPAWILAVFVLGVPLLTAVVSASVLLLLAGYRSALAKVLLVVVLFADVGFASYLCAWRWRHDGLWHVRPLHPALQPLLTADSSHKPPPRFVLFGDWPRQYAISPQANMLNRLAGLNGYGPFQLRAYSEMMADMNHDGLTHDDSLLTGGALDAWACRYVIIKRNESPWPRPLRDATRYRPCALADDFVVFENRRALPHARWLDPPTTRPGDQGVRSIRWINYGTNSLALEAATDRPATLLLADPCFPDWRATIDDMPAEVTRAEGIFRAIRVPAGQHTIRMHYDPASVRKGLFISLAGLGILIIWIIARAIVRITPARPRETSG